MKKKKEFKIEDIPNEVLAVWAASWHGGGVGADQLNNAIEKYAEYFPEEVEYREKWAKVPQELKDIYFNSKTNQFYLGDDDLDEKEMLFGKCPHPDIIGCGIIQRVTTYEHRGADFAENDAWNAKWYKHQHRRDIDLYNELFNPYGLSKNYED